MSDQATYELDETADEVVGEVDMDKDEDEEKKSRVEDIPEDSEELTL